MRLLWIVVLVLAYRGALGSPPPTVVVVSPPVVVVPRPVRLRCDRGCTVAMNRILLPGDCDGCPPGWWNLAP